MNEARPDVVLSFATWRRRMEKDDIYSFLERATSQQFSGNIKMVANIWDQDFDVCPPRLKDMLAERGVEVLTSKTNYRTHLKYCLVFQKYKGIPVVTFDDDQIYRKDAVQLLYDTHLKFPEAIIGGHCKIYLQKDGKRLPFRQCPTIRTGTLPSDPRTRTIGNGAALLPPIMSEKFSISCTDKWMAEVKGAFRNSDDTFLHWFAEKNGILAMPVMGKGMRFGPYGYLSERALSMSRDETRASWRYPDPKYN